MDLFVIILIITSLAIGWITTSGAKSQNVRLIDIFIYGPLLIYIGLNQPDMFSKCVLIIFGGTTIGYNFKNYLAQQ